MGGLCFWHNAGHDRPEGLSDHHLLHYFGTFGSFMHVFYILNAEAAWREKLGIVSLDAADVAQGVALEFPALDAWTAQLQAIAASGMMAVSGMAGDSD